MPSALAVWSQPLDHQAGPCHSFLKPLGTVRRESFCFPSKPGPQGTSLVAQWLRLWAPKSGGLGSITGQGTRFHRPQVRPWCSLLVQLCYCFCEINGLYCLLIVGLCFSCVSAFIIFNFAKHLNFGKQTQTVNRSVGSGK